MRTYFICVIALLALFTITNGDASAADVDAYLTDQYQSCADQATSDGDSSDCLYEEFERWDRILNEVWSQIIEVVKDYDDPSLRMGETLRESQRTWIKMRDLSCNFAYDAAGGGTMSAPASNWCLLEHTVHRAVWLDQLRQSM